MERLLNRSVKRAARKHGATYVNLYPVSRGHDACAGKDAWISGSKLDPARAANFHPFQEGMHQFGRAIYTKVTGLAALEDGNANAAPPLGSIILNVG